MVLSTNVEDKRHSGLLLHSCLNKDVILNASIIMLGSLLSEVGPLSGLLRLTLLEAQLPFWFVDKYLKDDSVIIFLDLVDRRHCLKMDARGSTSTGSFEGGYRPLTHSNLGFPFHLL